MIIDDRHEATIGNMPSQGNSCHGAGEPVAACSWSFHQLFIAKQQTSQLPASSERPSPWSPVSVL